MKKSKKSKLNFSSKKINRKHILFIFAFGLIGLGGLVYSSAFSNPVLVKGDFNKSSIGLGEFTNDDLRAAYSQTSLQGSTKGIPDRAKIVDVPGYGRMLQAYVPKDTVTVGKTGVSYTYRIPGGDKDELWLKQTFKLDKSWPWSKGPQNGGKFGPSFYIGPSRNSGCRPSDGGAAELKTGKTEAGSGGSVRISWSDNEGLADFYVYHADMGGDPEIKGSACGKKFKWVRDASGKVIYATPKNPSPNGNRYKHPVDKLTTYVLRVKLNTANNYNGEVDIYADGVHVGGIREIRFKLSGIKWGISQAGQNLFLGGQSEGHEFIRDTYYYGSPQTLYSSAPDKLSASAPNNNVTSNIVKTSTNTKPENPKNLELETSANSISASWSAVDGTDRYAIRYRMVGDSSYSKARSTNSTTYTIEDLENNKDYEVQVIAINSYGSSRWVTATAKVLQDDDIVEGQLPDRPILTSVTSTNKSINLKWSNARGADSYMVRFKRYSSDSWGKPIKVTSGTSYTIDNLSSGPRFDVQVISRNDTGFSRWSEKETIRTK